MNARLRVVAHEERQVRDAGSDPRDPDLYRTGIATARAALAEGVARRHHDRVDRETDGLDGIDGLEGHRPNGEDRR